MQGHSKKLKETNAEDEEKESIRHDELDLTTGDGQDVQKNGEDNDDEDDDQWAQKPWVFSCCCGEYCTSV